MAHHTATSSIIDCIIGRRRSSLAVLSLLLALATAPLADAADPQKPELLQVEMAVAGHQIMVNGAPFIIHGLTLVGLTAPKGSLTGAYLDAYQHLGGGELKAAEGWHANTIRFVLSQVGLDPNDPRFSEVYLHEVHRAVVGARNHGFLVIVSVNDEERSGEAVPHPMPTTATMRAWTTLSRLFNNDQGILYELFDAPKLAPSAETWRVWRDGDIVPGMTQGAGTTIGHQVIVDGIRATGSDNLIIADGLDRGESLDGCPLLTDSRRKVAYGAHPYFTLNNRSGEQWERNFAAVARRAPVIATEWTAPTGDPTNWCQSYPDKPLRHLPRELLVLLQHFGIGVVAFAFDLPGTVVTDYLGTPNDYTGFACGEHGGGPGWLLRYAFSR